MTERPLTDHERRELRLLVSSGHTVPEAVDRVLGTAVLSGRGLPSREEATQEAERND